MLNDEDYEGFHVGQYLNDSPEAPAGEENPTVRARSDAWISQNPLYNDDIHSDIFSDSGNESDEVIDQLRSYNPDDDYSFIGDDYEPDDIADEDDDTVLEDEDDLDGFDLNLSGLPETRPLVHYDPNPDNSLANRRNPHLIDRPPVSNEEEDLDAFDLNLSDLPETRPLVHYDPDPDNSLANRMNPHLNDSATTVPLPSVHSSPSISSTRFRSKRNKRGHSSSSSSSSRYNSPNYSEHNKRSRF